MPDKISRDSYYFPADAEFAMMMSQMERWRSLPRSGAGGCCVGPSLAGLKE